ncbi:MAG: hypothetical protein ACTSUO_08795 [Candidatus Thorarchaeota archaeon]
MALDPEPLSDGPPPQAFTVSVTELVTRTFTIWTRKIISYVVIGGMLFSFLIAIAIAIGYFVPIEYFVTDLSNFFFGITAFLYGYTVADVTTFFSVSIIVIIITLVLTAIATGAIIKFALDDYGYKRADVGTSMSAAMSSFVTLFMVITLSQLLMAIFSGPMSFFSEVAISSMDLTTFVIGDEFAANMMILMAAMMVVVFYITIRITPASAVIMAEDVSVVDAFKRSFELTKGNFFHTFIGIILIGIVVTVLDLIIYMFIGDFFGSIVNMLVLSSITYVFHAVLYQDLNSRSATTKQSTDWW